MVTDLEAWDSLHLEGFGYTTAAQVRTDLSQVGEDVVFADQGVTVIFENTTLAQIENDQLFYS